MDPHQILLIYAGGTFGCHGSPLVPLPPEVFLPNLIDKIPYLKDHISVIPNSLIKDSSQLSSQDFFYFYELILSRYQLGYKKFLLVTGTDTLSYFGSFLAESFANSDILIALTASMEPLFHPRNNNLTINYKSDAWSNLNTAIKQCQKPVYGVFTCLSNHSWNAQSIQKVHSHNQDAFIGNQDNQYPANSYQLLSVESRQYWLTDRINNLSKLKNRIKDISISIIFVAPNNPNYLTSQLSQTLHSKQQATILLEFGSGNIPYSKKLTEIFDQAYQNGHIIISSTQCFFGGVNSDYAAGSWQYEHHVLSGETLTTEAIFSRLLWIYINYESPMDRRRQWITLLNQ